MLFKEMERFLKRILKKKYKYTKMLLITFLMTGGLGMAVPITPNANGEYIVNSGTGDGEILNFLINDAFFSFYSCLLMLFKYKLWNICQLF